uniref:Piwi domain-containing protein n=1 Tax=Globodera pallida TaxID=36090 RepID=A0A183BPR4_GLOPA
MNSNNGGKINLIGKQTIYHYEVTINGVSSKSDRKFCLSEPNGPRDRDDFPLLNRRDKCRDVFLAFNQTMERSLRETGNLLYYDLSKTIFTLKKLELQGEVKYVFNIGTVPSVERPDATRFEHYEFIIKPAMGLEIGDLSFLSNNMAKKDCSLEKFLDIATSQSDLIKKCAVKPFVLREQTEKLKFALDFGRNEHLERAAIKFDEQPMEVESRILKTPEMNFGDQSARPGARPGRYLIAAKCLHWCAIALVDNSNDNYINPAQWRDFVRVYSSQLNKKRMNFPEPARVELVQIGSSELGAIFDTLQNSGVEFVLFAHPSGHSGDAVHHAMKYFELKTEVISQGVLISTVRAVLHKGNPLTVEDIVNKTNIKNGGLNYALPFSKNMLADTLVIGFGMNQSAGGLGMASEKNNGDGGNGSNGSNTGSEVANDNGNGGNNGHSASKANTEKSTPSVVGYALNIGENHNFEFVGDYKYQEARRDEKLHLVEHIVCRCLDEYKRREKKYPSSVVIYRNACGEGFYQHILTYDVPLIKSLLKEHCTAKLKMIVVNKMQGIKFIPSNINVNAKAIEQNVKPGTVIGKPAVSPQWTEFFLAAQRALHFGHQLHTSLPAPVFIALEFVSFLGAERMEMLENISENELEKKALQTNGIVHFVFAVHRRIRCLRAAHMRAARGLNAGTQPDLENRIATHETGHVFAFWLMREADAVTVRQVGPNLGCTYTAGRAEYTHGQLFARLCGVLGGAMAELTRYGTHALAIDDYAKAQQIAHTIVYRFIERGQQTAIFSMARLPSSPETQPRINSLLFEAKRTVLAGFENPQTWTQLVALADHLLAVGSMTRNELVAMIGLPASERLLIRRLFSFGPLCTSFRNNWLLPRIRMQMTSSTAVNPSTLLPLELINKCVGSKIWCERTPEGKRVTKCRLARNCVVVVGSGTLHFGLLIRRRMVFLVCLLGSLYISCCSPVRMPDRCVPSFTPAPPKFANFCVAEARHGSGCWYPESSGLVCDIGTHCVVFKMTDGFCAAGMEPIDNALQQILESLATDRLSRLEQQQKQQQHNRSGTIGGSRRTPVNQLLDNSQQQQQKKRELANKEREKVNSLGICLNCGRHGHSLFQCRWGRISDDALQKKLREANLKLQRQELDKQELKRKAENFPLRRKDPLIERLRVAAPEGKIKMEHIRMLCPRCAHFNHKQIECSRPDIGRTLHKQICTQLEEFKKAFFVHLQEDKMVDISQKFDTFRVMDGIELNGTIDPVGLQLHGMCPDGFVTQMDLRELCSNCAQLGHKRIDCKETECSRTHFDKMLTLIKGYRALVKEGSGNFLLPRTNMNPSGLVLKDIERSEPIEEILLDSSSDEEEVVTVPDEAVNKSSSSMPTPTATAAAAVPEEVVVNNDAVVTVLTEKVAEQEEKQRETVASSPVVQQNHSESALHSRDEVEEDDDDDIIMSCD